MAQKIDLSKGKAQLPAANIDLKTSALSHSAESYSTNLEFLIQTYPSKILFNIKEAAKLLGQSYESIRIRIKNGKINSKSFGTRKMIHRDELAKIITEGIM